MATSTITQIKLPNGDIAILHDSRVDSMGDYMKFKGVKDTVAQIKALTSSEKGDVWIAREDSSEWICTTTFSGGAQPTYWEQFGTVTQKGVAYFGTSTITAGHVALTKTTTGNIESGTVKVSYDKSNTVTGSSSTPLLSAVTVSSKSFAGTTATIAVTGAIAGDTESTTLEGTVSKVVTTMSQASGGFIKRIGSTTASYTPSGSVSITPTTENIGSVSANLETTDIDYATGVVSTKTFTGTTTRFDTATALTSGSTFAQGTLPEMESKTYATGVVSSATFTGNDNYVLAEDAVKSVSLNNGATTNITYANGTVSSAGKFTGTSAAIAVSSFLSSLTIDTVNNALVISTANAMTSLGGSTSSYTPAGTQGKPTLSKSTQTVLTANPTLTTTTAKFLRNAVGTSTTGYSIKPTGSVNITLATASHNMIKSVGTLPTFTPSTATVLKNSIVASGGFAYQPAGTLNIVLATTSAKAVSKLPTISQVTVMTGATAGFTGTSVTVTTANAVTAITPTWDNPTYAPTAHSHAININGTFNGSYQPSGTINVSVTGTTADHTHSIGHSSQNATVTYEMDNA